jgi:tetratricopeptide (TPR) repeat protein
MSDNALASLEKIDARLSRLVPATDTVPCEEMLSELRKAFQDHAVVFLVGEDGSGRSATAAQFAQQQVLAGALGENPVLYTPFLTCRSLTELLDGFGQVYEWALLDRQIFWQGLDDFQRFKLVQDVLKRVPLLWVWDDVDEIYHQQFSAWDKDQIDQLLELLQTIPEGAAHVLIVSNQEMPVFRQVSPVWIQQRLVWQNPLARKLAVAHSEGLEAASDSLEDLVKKALQVFSNQEQSLLLVTGLFTGLFHVDTLQVLVKKVAANTGQEIVDLDSGDILEFFSSASRGGLFSPIAGGYFSIHPAIRRIFLSLMGQDFRRKAEQAFPRVMADHARATASRQNHRNQDVIGLLAVEEANLRNALSLTKKYHGQKVLQELLATLRRMFISSRRWASWENVLDQFSSFFIHPDTLEPASSSRQLVEPYYDWRVEIARKREGFNRAAHWQAVKVIWERKQAESGSSPGRKKEVTASASVRLAQALGELAAIYRTMGSPKAIEAYQEAFQLAMATDQKRLASEYARQIAEAYVGIPVVRNYDQANEWVKKSLGLLNKRQQVERSLALATRGKINSEKFVQSVSENQPAEEKVKLLNAALESYFFALDTAPENADSERGNLHESIGYLYLQSDAQLEIAIEQYEMAIRCYEKTANTFQASKTRFNLAIALFLLNQRALSQDYALAALKGFDALGLDALVEYQKVSQFLKRFPETAT